MLVNKKKAYMPKRSKTKQGLPTHIFYVANDDASNINAENSNL